MESFVSAENFDQLDAASIEAMLNSLAASNFNFETIFTEQAHGSTGNSSSANSSATTSNNKSALSLADAHLLSKKRTFSSRSEESSDSEDDSLSGNFPETDDARRKRLARKAELARLARARKKNRLIELEIENEKLRSRLGKYEDIAGNPYPNVVLGLTITPALAAQIILNPSALSSFATSAVNSVFPQVNVAAANSVSVPTPVAAPSRATITMTPRLSSDVSNSSSCSSDDDQSSVSSRSTQNSPTPMSTPGSTPGRSVASNSPAFMPISPPAVPVASSTPAHMTHSIVPVPMQSIASTPSSMPMMSMMNNAAANCFMMTSMNAGMNPVSNMNMVMPSFPSMMSSMPMQMPNAVPSASFMVQPAMPTMSAPAAIATVAATASDPNDQLFYQFLGSLAANSEKRSYFAKLLQPLTM